MFLWQEPGMAATTRGCNEGRESRPSQVSGSRTIPRLFRRGTNQNLRT